ncbi:MAG: flippase [Niabella sp.]
MSVSKNYWLKNGLINIFQNLSTVFFGFVSFYFLVRLLSKDDWGAWGLFLSTISIVEIARNGLTQEPLVKYLSAANRLDKRKIITASFFINIIMSLLVCIVFLIAIPLLAKSWNSQELNHMFHIYLITFFITGITSQLNFIEQAHLRFTGNFYTNFLRQLVLFLYIAYCYISPAQISLITLTYVHLLAGVLSAITAFVFTRKLLKYTVKIDKEWMKKIFHFGKYSFGVSLSSVLSASIDQMMLGSMLSKAASGAFNIAVRITNLADIPTNAMAAILFPQSSIRFEKQGGESVKYLYEKSVGVVLAILIPVTVILILFSDLVINIVVGNKYPESVQLLRLTLLVCIFIPFGRQAGTAFSSSGNVKINFYMIILNTILIIVCNYFLIDMYGVVGAAYTTLIANVVGFAICQYYLYKLFRINALNSFIYAVKFYPEFLNKFLRNKNG